jgi:hypothetical protein
MNDSKKYIVEGKIADPKIISEVLRIIVNCLLSSTAAWPARSKDLSLGAHTRSIAKNLVAFELTNIFNLLRFPTGHSHHLVKFAI